MFRHLLAAFDTDVIPYPTFPHTFLTEQMLLQKIDQHKGDNNTQNDQQIIPESNQLDGIQHLYKFLYYLFRDNIQNKLNNFHKYRYRDYYHQVSGNKG